MPLDSLPNTTQRHHTMATGIGFDGGAYRALIDRHIDAFELARRRDALKVDLRGLGLRQLGHNVCRRRDKELLKRWILDLVTPATTLALETEGREDVRLGVRSRYIPCRVGPVAIGHDREYHLPIRSNCAGDFVRLNLTGPV